MTIDEGKMRELTKKYLQNRFTGEDLCDNVCEAVWEEMLGDIDEEWTDEDDAKAFQVFNTVYGEYMSRILGVLNH